MTNFDSDLFGGGDLCGKIFDGKFSSAETCTNVMPHPSKLRKLLVSLDISQHNALVIFSVKRSTISEIS